MTGATTAGHGAHGVGWAARPASGAAAAEAPFAGRPAAVSLSFDDARASQLEVALPLLDERGLRASFYVLPGPLAERAEAWRAAALAGHELGNHSSSHPCGASYPFSRDNALEELDLAELAADVDAASGDIERLTGFRPRTFAYPCGQSFVGRGAGRASYVPLVAERFLAGRGYGGETPNDPHQLDLAHLEAISLDGRGLVELVELVEQVRWRGSWLVLAGHDVGPPGYQHLQRDVLAGLCEVLRGLVAAGELLVAPVAEVAEVLAASWDPASEGGG